MHFSKIAFAVALPLALASPVKVMTPSYPRTSADIATQNEARALGGIGDMLGGILGGGKPKPGGGSTPQPPANDYPAPPSDPYIPPVDPYIPPSMSTLHLRTMVQLRTHPDTHSSRSY